MTTEIPTWHKHAACTGRAELFFEETRKTIAKKAKAICATCPVQEPCLEHAIANDEIGIWGGKTTNERRKIRRMRRSLIAKKIEIQPKESQISGSSEV